jgi:hypothetical protein
VLAVLGTAAFVASLGPAYRRVRAFDTALVWRGEAVLAGLAALGIPAGAAAAAVVLMPVAGAFIGAGVLIVLRRPQERVAVLFAAILIAFSLN